MPETRNSQAASEELATRIAEMQEELNGLVSRLVRNEDALEEILSHRERIAGIEQVLRDRGIPV